MEYYSRLVASSQTGPHEKLEQVLDRHCSQPWQAPLHSQSVGMLQRLDQLLPGWNRQSLILDSGCGSGDSSRNLAARYPDYLVLGVDQSAARLAKVGAERKPVRQDNCLWLRAELSTIWRLLAGMGVVLHKHYLLYPNPYPKPAQLRRRWHGHPVFPLLPMLGGALELRTNWEIYAQEFALAASRLCGYHCVAESYRPRTPISAFESKYHHSGHALFRVHLQWYQDQGDK